MKLTIQADDLRELVANTAPAAKIKGTQPALACIMLCTHDDNILVASATDLEIGIRFDAPVQVIEPSKVGVLLPARELAAIAKELEGEVTIEAKRDSATITADGARFALVGPDPLSWAFIESPANTAHVAVSGSQLVSAMRSTMFAVAREETRYAINGVLLNITSGVVDVVGTDGRRLAVAEIQHKGKIEAKCVVPARGAALIAKTIDEDADCRLLVDKNTIGVEQNGRVLAVRRLDSRFPDYEQVLPKKSDVQVTFDREDMIKAVRGVASILSGDMRVISLDITQDQIALTSSQSSIGEGRTTVACESTGNGKIQFNANYLLEGLQSTKAETISLSLTKDSGPALFDLDSSRYVLMPITAT